MKLKSLIALLEKADQDKYIDYSIGNPHSWRGSYDELSFEPGSGATVRQMLEEVKSSIGPIFCGWKGGNYTYDGETQVHFSYRGSSEEHEEWFVFMVSELFE